MAFLPTLLLKAQRAVPWGGSCDICGQGESVWMWTRVSLHPRRDAGRQRPRGTAWCAHGTTRRVSQIEPFTATRERVNSLIITISLVIISLPLKTPKLLIDASSY